MLTITFILSTVSGSGWTGLNSIFSELVYISVSFEVTFHFASGIAEEDQDYCPCFLDHGCSGHILMYNTCLFGRKAVPISQEPDWLEQRKTNTICCHLYVGSKKA